jgi:hypothetical protein
MPLKCYKATQQISTGIIHWLRWQISYTTLRELQTIFFDAIWAVVQRAQTLR